MKKRYIIWSVLWCFFISQYTFWAYTPSHIDVAIKKYLHTQVIDANWKTRSEENKKNIKQRMFDQTNILTNDRLLWFTHEMMAYRDDKRANETKLIEIEEEDANIQVDIVNDINEANGTWEEELPLKNVTVSPNDIWSLIVRSWPGKEYWKIDSLLVWETVSVYEEENAYFRILIDASPWWIAVEYVHLAWTEAPTHHLTPPAPSASISSSKKDFLDRYRPLVDRPSLELSDLCKKYYDQIDAVAREYDFPPELIIATWYREHTCIFKNPSNGRGNFQITSNRYEPGPISRTQFQKQIVDFINFSKKKWDYYDAIQVFGPEPVAITYDSYDLTSIRKQSILYNGIVWELETNVYANQNFNWVSVWWRDGIVAHVLKVLKWRWSGVR